MKTPEFSATSPRDEPLVLIGGSGFIGTAIARAAVAAGRHVTVIDRQPTPIVNQLLRWEPCDLLLADEPAIPNGRIIVLIGGGNPRPRWPWTLPLDTCLATGRLLPRLRDRRVMLISSVEMYGWSPGELTEDTKPELPWGRVELNQWCQEVRVATRQCCPHWQGAALCRRLAEADGSGRWVYALAKWAQETLLAESDLNCDLTVLRVANTFGVGQERVVSRLVRRALAGLPLTVVGAVVRSFIPVDRLAALVLSGPPSGVFNVGGPPVQLRELAHLIKALCGSDAPIVDLTRDGSDSSGAVCVRRLTAATGFDLRSVRDDLKVFIGELCAERRPFFSPPLPVVIPPRPVRPDVVAERQQTCLWHGRLKNGNRWSVELREKLEAILQVPSSHEILVTTSGTEALRLAVAATAGVAQSGDVACN